MRNWKDVACAAIGLCILVLGPVYLHFHKPEGGPINGIMSANQEPGKLYPACDYYPNGLNGKPCVEADTFERTGHLVFHKPGS